MKQRLKKYGINLFGNNLKDKFIVFESDDWGSIRIPNNSVKNELLKIQAIQEKDAFSMYDCLESSLDFKALFKTLSNHVDFKGKNPIFTANMVMANPDFKTIKLNNFEKYYWELFPETYEKYYPNSLTFDSLMEGVKKKYLFPQFHATEHLNLQKWMNKLRNGDVLFLKAFDLDCFAIDDHTITNKRSNLMASYDYLSEEELNEIEERIFFGLKVFKDIFGYCSTTSIAPCYVWNDEIERIFLNNGIKGIQSSYVQQKNELGRLKRRWKVMGNRNKRGQNYLVRNVLFEPALDGKINWVDRSFESINIAFKLGKPAVIGSHRINYVGGLCESNRENSLMQLDELLHRVLKKWPDVEFLNSAELVEKYINA